MTHVVQTEVAPIVWFPLAVQPPGRQFNLAEPMGWLIHTQDALAIDDIGVGDTGGFVLQLPLRKNYGYKLVQASVQVRDTDGGASVWRRPSMRVYWHPKPSINPAQTTELTYPMGQSLVVSAELLESSHFSMGAGIATNSAVVNGNMVPTNYPEAMPIIYGYTSGGGIDPEFMMTNASASQDNYTCSFQFRWLAYSIEATLTKPQSVIAAAGIGPTPFMNR